MSPLVQTKEFIKKLPDKKAHLEFIAALLTIPVLITVLLTNLGNLQTKKSIVTPTSTQPTPIIEKQPVIIIQGTGSPTSVVSPTPTSTPTPTNTPTPTVTPTIAPTSSPTPTSIKSGPTAIPTVTPTQSQ